MPPQARNGNRQRRRLVAILGGLAAFALALFAAFWLLDYFLVDAAAAHHRQGPIGQLFDYDPQTMQNALGSLSQVIASVLGIAITVVSIVVQLAATRYTPRVADLFFRDRINVGVMGFFVIACVESVWVSFVVRNDYVPQATVTLTVLMSSASLLVLVPYFAYVFDFLDPEKVIARIGQQTLDRATSADAGARRRTFTERQALAVSGLAHLADIAVNALGQKDKVIASEASAALRRLLVHYQTRKESLEPEWFSIGAPLRTDPDFVALADDSLDDLAHRRTWLEWKGLRQIREVFGAALNSMPEMAHVVAIDTRTVGEAALAAGSPEVFALTVKFMNTYLRAALNARDVRTAYNVLNQYRQLAEALLAAPEEIAWTELASVQPSPAWPGGDPARGGGAPDRWPSAMLVEIAVHFKYYARLAHGNDMGFVTETAAYDLCALCEVAAVHQADCQDRLLEVLLTIDDAPETRAEERALRGVRKAQAKLASYYLSTGETARARAIFDDMAAESPARLRSIRDEMLAVTAKDFWEVVDRGANFDYLPEPRKERLRQFFAQFPALAEDRRQTSGGG
jgi:hypothetical protein